MSAKTDAAGKPVIETTVEIDAPIESVWKGLTDATELMRWFPLSARVNPGPGGEVWMSWGPPWEGASRIDAWEPHKLLRTRGFLEHGDGSVVEYTLEARGGKTTLRLVHSGFAAGAEWEKELFEGTRRGWRYELRSLRHYLERHRGEDRRVAWPKAPVSVDAEEAWRRLLGPEGFVREGSIEGLKEGERYRVKAATGERFEGQVVVNEPPFEFAGTIENLSDALISLRVHEVAGPESGSGHTAGIWLSAYGRAAAEVEAFRERWQGVLDRLFA
jgi:uncharacterized protein YndB with AHSA1/START domain